VKSSIMFTRERRFRGRALKAGSPAVFLSQTSCTAVHAPLIQRMSRHLPTRVPVSPFPHMCAWDENLVTSSLDTLLHNIVLAMLAVKHR
jgi:hypothetical protein